VYRLAPPPAFFPQRHEALGDLGVSTWRGRPAEEESSTGGTSGAGEAGADACSHRVQ
jgi:hypothetical protein